MHSWKLPPTPLPIPPALRGRLPPVDERNQLQTPHPEPYDHPDTHPVGEDKWEDRRWVYNSCTDCLVGLSEDEAENLYKWWLREHSSP